jgi:hypothetical protein
MSGGSPSASIGPHCLPTCIYTPASPQAQTSLIWLDEFSALRHGDVVIVRTFVLCVMSYKSRDYVGTIRKTMLPI